MKFQRFLSVELNVQGCFVIQLSSFALLLLSRRSFIILSRYSVCVKNFFIFRFRLFLKQLVYYITLSTNVKKKFATIRSIIAKAEKKGFEPLRRY